MNDEDLKKFKWMLHNQQPNDFITKHALDKATREDTVDLLVERYPRTYCGITRKVLQKCGHNNMAGLLKSCEYCWHSRFEIDFGGLPLCP